MCATAVAATVLAMKTDSVPLSPEPVPSSKPGVLVQGMKNIFLVLQKVFLPHLAAGMGAFLIIAFATYMWVLQPARLPSTLNFLVAFVFFIFYGCVVFFYSCLAASVFALRTACVTLEDFIDNILTQVKENIASRIDDMNEGLAKDQAKVLVSGSVRDVFRTVRKQELKKFPRLLAALFLGSVTIAMRSVLIARIAKISSTTVQLSKVFAGRATIIGAIFLNLRLFSTLLLLLVYGVGGPVLFANCLLVWWLK